MKRYTQHIVSTPQSEALNPRQVENSAGGFSYAVDDWVRLDRFLILGTEGGSYYASERKLTREGAAAVQRCLAVDAKRTVDRIVEISESGRAPKNDPAIFALALAASHDSTIARAHALAALPRVARIGTHLFQFTSAVDEMRGWGRGLRNAIGKWYTEKSPDDLALQVTKYRQRGGWSHRDLLRLSHPNTLKTQAVLRWAVKGELTPDAPALLERFTKAQEAKTAKELAPLIEAGLTWEMIPTELLGDPEVWRLLIPTLPMTAMLRNLARMTASGALQAMTDESQIVCDKLTNAENLKRARVHPIAVLAAALTYANGRGARGSLTWNPISQVNDALDAAFYASFGNVVPSGKKLRVALDVSGSMSGGEIAGVPGLTPRVASAAMAMIWAKTEPMVEFQAFSHELIPFDMSKRRSLDGVCRAMDAISFGGTDCALPIVDASKSKVKRDGFIILTDSETWAGRIHPSAALEKYRRVVNPAKLVVVGMVSNEFTIADPADSGMMDVVGFDTATPNLIGDFMRS